MSVQADPLLQGNYLQEDTEDFSTMSAAIEQFEARLASGQPVHSKKLPPRCPRAAPGTPLYRGTTKANGNQNMPQQQQQLVKRRSVASASQRGSSNQPLSDEAIERLEEIEAVRQLKDDPSSDDDD